MSTSRWASGALEIGSLILGVSLVFVGALRGDPSVTVLGSVVLGVPLALPAASSVPSAPSAPSNARPSAFELARERYLNADPLDHTATLGFLMAADERERSPISPPKPHEYRAKCIPHLYESDGRSVTDRGAGDALMAAHRTGCVVATVDGVRWHRAQTSPTARVWMWRSSAGQAMFTTK